jgi:hypothetical protein
MQIRLQHWPPSPSTNSTRSRKSRSDADSSRRIQAGWCPWFIQTLGRASSHSTARYGRREEHELPLPRSTTCPAISLGSFSIDSKPTAYSRNSAMTTHIHRATSLSGTTSPPCTQRRPTSGSSTILPTPDCCIASAARENQAIRCLAVTAANGPKPTSCLHTARHWFPVLSH